jgi:hypothetical protein
MTVLDGFLSILAGGCDPTLITPAGRSGVAGSRHELVNPCGSSPLSSSIVGIYCRRCPVNLSQGGASDPCDHTAMNLETMNPLQ